MNLGLENKTALITASSKGIGKAVALAFAEEGANVVICSRNFTAIDKTADELRALGKGKVIAVTCDINDPEQIKETVKIALRHFGCIDILVNNCGGPSAGFFDTLAESKWDEAYRQVLLSAQRFIKLSTPRMKEKKWGRIINITSVSVHQPIENLILSNTFRAALTGMSKTLSTQLAKFNITVNNIAPGYTHTDRIQELALEKSKISGQSINAVMAEMTKEIPMGRMAAASEIAAGVLFFASEQAGYVTGNSMHMDGGLVKGLF